MLSGPSSAAIIFAKPWIAVFGIVVVRAPGNNCVPVTPDTFSILPALDFLMCGTAYFVVCTKDMRLVFRIVSQISGVTLSIVPGIIPPTLFTRMSIPPRRY